MGTRQAWGGGGVGGGEGEGGERASRAVWKLGGGGPKRLPPPPPPLQGAPVSPTVSPTVSCGKTVAARECTACTVCLGPTSLFWHCSRLTSSVVFFLFLLPCPPARVLQSRPSSLRWPVHLPDLHAAFSSPHVFIRVGADLPGGVFRFSLQHPPAPASAPPPPPPTFLFG